MVSQLGRPLGGLVLALVLAGSGAYLYHRYRDADWERRYAEYQRQLHGDLTERERQIEALNTQLGLTRSQLVTQSDLDQRYQAQLTAKDRDFEQFRREHALALKSVSDSLFALQEQSRGGTELAREVPSAPSRPGEALAPSARPVVSYEYTDTGSRVHLTDPNIWVQGDEVLQLKQFFRVEGTVMQQVDGSLMAERVQLLEVAPEGTGHYRKLAEAQVVDAHFTYANAPSKDPPSGFSPSWMVTVGTSFQGAGRLRLGASARVVRLGALGLAAGLSSDLESLEGSGGDAFITYTPSLEGRELRVVLGGGIHLPLGGSQRVRPGLTLNFVVD